MHYVGVVIGIYVSFFLMTKCLPPEVIGLTNVVYNAAYLLSTLALLGSGSSGMRFFPFFKDEKSGNHGFFYYYRMLPVIGIVLFSILYLAFKEPIISYFSVKSRLFTDFFYYVLPLFWVLTFWVFFENYANIFMRIAVPKAVREVGMRLLQIGILLAYYYHWIDNAGLILTYIGCYALCMFTTGFYSMHIGCTVTKHDWSFITPELRRKFLTYTGFLMISAISSSIMNQIDAFMLTGMKGLYDVGIYAIVQHMAEVVNMPNRSITPIASPLAAEAMKEGDYGQVRSLFRKVSVHQTLAACILMLFIWINLDNIYTLIPRGEDYAAGRWAVLFQGLGRIFAAAVTFGTVLISFSRYYYWTLILTIFLTVLTICTNLYFIPLYGLNGAALATMITLGVSNLLLLILVFRLLKCHPLSWAHLRILVVVTILFGLNWLIPALPESTTLWWMAVVDIVVRSGILFIICVVLVYKFQISEQINGIIDNYWGKLKR